MWAATSEPDTGAMFSPITTQMAREDRADRLAAQAERARLVRSAVARRSVRAAKRERRHGREVMTPAPATC
jgi:hypothetical protein